MSERDSNGTYLSAVPVGFDCSVEIISFPNGATKACENHSHIST